MSWDKIDNHLFDKYCVEGEDKELSNLMKEHDKEIRAKAINEFVTIMEEWNDNIKSIRNEDAFFTIENIHKVAEQMKEV